MKYYTNDDFENTNMVESLMAAKSEFDDDIIVSYSDILFDEELLKGMIDANADFGCAVDDNWKEYWKKRYGKVDFDTESLAIDDGNNITELGLESPGIDVIDARYIGLLKFSKNGLKVIDGILADAYKHYIDKPWQQSGKSVKKAYMTDLLNAVIESGRQVKAIRFVNGWIEFDTNEDYENAERWYEDGSLNKFIQI